MKLNIATRNRGKIILSRSTGRCNARCLENEFLQLRLQVDTPEQELKHDARPPGANILDQLRTREPGTGLRLKNLRVRPNHHGGPVVALRLELKIGDRGHFLSRLSSAFPISACRARTSAARFRRWSESATLSCARPPRRFSNRPRHPGGNEKSQP